MRHQFKGHNNSVGGAKKKETYDMDHQFLSDKCNTLTV